MKQQSNQMMLVSSTQRMPQFAVRTGTVVAYWKRLVDTDPHIYITLRWPLRV
jgi:hypothetical protein